MIFEIVSDVVVKLVISGGIGVSAALLIQKHKAKQSKKRCDEMYNQFLERFREESEEDARIYAALMEKKRKDNEVDARRTSAC